MGAVHLGVVELQGDGEAIAQEAPAIAAPNEEGVVENTAVHAHGSVDLGVDDGRGADDHAVFRQIPVNAEKQHEPSNLCII